MKQCYSGINIQYPISKIIVSGKKTIETRTYPLPEKYINVPLALVETPGKTGTFKSRVIAIVTFDNCFRYKNKTEFYLDSKKHCIDQKSPWAWAEKPKWGWNIKKITLLKTPEQLKQRPGIVFSNNIEIDFR